MGIQERVSISQDPGRKQDSPLMVQMKRLSEGTICRGVGGAEGTLKGQGSHQEAKSRANCYHSKGQRRERTEL